MRELKFRAWDKLNSMMLYPNGQLITWYDCKVWLQLCHPYNHNYGLDRSPDKPENLHLMQYTGLHDKNGKEIYEGDIVNDRDVIGVVEYEDDNIRFEIRRKNGFSMIWTSKTIEVIGNIYENSELLKGA